MIKDEWSDLYDKLEIMESYFQDVLHKAVNFKTFGTETQKHDMAIHAKQVEKGTTGLLHHIVTIKEVVFHSSGAVHIPVKAIYDNKPQLTILEGGVSNDLKTSNSPHSKPATCTLPFGKIGGT